MNSIDGVIVRYGIVMVAVLLSMGASSAPGAIDMPEVFSDNMVLQRGLCVPVWGTAEPGEKVSVCFAGQTRQTVAGDNGKWLVKLDPLKASSK